MEVLKYLKTKSLEDLTEEFSIKVKKYTNGLAVLNYSQIDSPKYHPIVRECRGLIIDYVNLCPVSKTFKRFYNLNENVNDDFDFDGGFIAQEKADGSLVPVYFFDDEWHMGTRGTAFGEGTTSSGMTFREIFEGIIGTDINTFMKGRSIYYSYVFEMCSIHNKVVKLYEDGKIYLLAVQWIGDDIECINMAVDAVAKELNVHRPIDYDIDDIDDVVESFKDFEASEEGYVLIDSKFNRVKVKNPAYVDLHHLKGNGEITPKRIVGVIFRGETEEVLSYFPEYREFFEPKQEAYNRLVDDIETWWIFLNSLGDISQKDFALHIKDLHFKGILFSLRKGLTIQESFDKIGSSGKINLLGE